jgi:hypothetical protein
MDKKELLQRYQKAKISAIAGILHNYTPNGTLAEAEALESLIKKHGSLTVEKGLHLIEDCLEF